MSHSRERAVANDFSKGGKFAFASTRDPQVPPFSCIQDGIQVSVSPMRWKKEGNDILIVKEGSDRIDLNFPVTFQGQHAFVTRIQGNFVQLDRKIINRDSHDLFLRQTQILSDPDQVHDRTRQSWSELWQREGPNDRNEDWHEALLKSLHCKTVLHVIFNLSTLLHGRPM